MTAEQKRLRIAKLQGWTKLEEWDPLHGVHPNFTGAVNYKGEPFVPPIWEIPDYLNDRNAMSQILRSLDDEEWLEFMLRLCDLLGAQQDLGKWTLTRRLMEATASQQATAYLLVKNEYDP